MVRICSDSVCPCLRTTNASLLFTKVTVKSSVSVLCWSQMGQFTFQSSTCVTMIIIYTAGSYETVCSTSACVLKCLRAYERTNFCRCYCNGIVKSESLWLRSG